MSKFILYNYFRSSAAFRVRMALELKKIPYEYRAIHLLKDGGQHNQEEYRKLNPMGEVPCLVHVEGEASFPLAQSMAIFQYLDALFPTPELFPSAPKDRARVVQLCENVNCGIHPIQNLKVLNRLSEQFQADQSSRTEWARYWIRRGFQGIEKMLESTAGSFCYGGSVTAADLYILPQIGNAHRFGVNMGEFPILSRMEQTLSELKWVIAARPDQQPDFQK